MIYWIKNSSTDVLYDVQPTMEDAKESVRYLEKEHPEKTFKIIPDPELNWEDINFE